MADRSVARRWARALLQLAEAEDAVDLVSTDFTSLLGACDANDQELFRALANPLFTVEERMSVLDRLLPRLGLHSITRNLAKLLMEKGRFALLYQIAGVFADLADARANRVRVDVETAVPIGPRLEGQVKAALAKVTGKHVILHTHTNPALIGGMVARVGGKVYDASVRARLDDLREQLVHSQIPGES
jgi:F-type H+-transporting ATPase subunit delta